MKLTTKGRYAVMALADLANFSDQNPVSLRDISLRQGISLNYLEQIFSKLKKDDIVKSIRGKNGGYICANQANKICFNGAIYVSKCKNNLKISLPYFNNQDCLLLIFKNFIS